MADLINDAYGVEVSASTNTPESNFNQYEAKHTLDNEEEEDGDNSIPIRKRTDDDDDLNDDYDSNLEQEQEEPSNEADNVIYPEQSDSQSETTDDSNPSFYDSKKLAQENEFGASELNATDQFSGEFGEMKPSDNSNENDYISFNGMAGDDSSNARADFENQPDIIFGNSNENSLFNTYSENDNSLELSNESQFQDILGFGSLGINSDNDFLGFKSFNSAENGDNQFGSNGFGNDNYMAGILGIGALGVEMAIGENMTKSSNKPPVTMNGAFTDGLKKAVNIGKAAVSTVGEKLASKTKTVAKNVYDEHIASPDIYDKLGDTNEANRIRYLRLKKAEEKQQKLAEKQKHDDAVTQYKLQLDRTKHPEKYDENGELKESESSKPTVLNYVKNRVANIENEYNELTDDSILFAKPSASNRRRRSVSRYDDDDTDDWATDFQSSSSSKGDIFGFQGQSRNRTEDDDFFNRKSFGKTNANYRKSASASAPRNEGLGLMGIPLGDALGFSVGADRPAMGNALDDTLGFGSMRQQSESRPQNTPMQGFSLDETLGFSRPINPVSDTNRSQSTKDNVNAFKKKNKTSSSKKTKKIVPSETRIPNRSAYDAFMKKPDKPKDMSGRKTIKPKNHTSKSKKTKS